MNDWFAEFSRRGLAVIDSFLPDETCRALYDEQRAAFAAGAFREGRVGRGDPQLDAAERRDFIRWLDLPGQAPSAEGAAPAFSGAWLDFAAALFALRDVLRLKAFLPLRTQEFHAAVYGAGGFYQRHVDAFRDLNSAVLEGGRSRRLVSCVYYLSPDRTAADGGQLRLYPPEAEEAVEILPVANRLVLFESHLPHEVRLNHRERYSLTGWLKS